MHVDAFWLKKTITISGSHPRTPNWREGRRKLREEGLGLTSLIVG